MKIAGIIAEYDPFHKGHAWHIAETRRLSGCDRVIVCMAGHFTQRGDAAICSKWARARAALACGADAVFELPAMYAVRTADVFARGGVAILGGLGADVLSFGCETDDLSTIAGLAALRDAEPAEVSAAVRRRLAEGDALPRARGEALAEHLGLPCEAINRPNLILATEYVRAIGALRLQMVPLAIRRIGGYHDPGLGGFASASAIRAAFAGGDAEAAMEAIPEKARRWMQPDRMHEPDDLLLDRLRTMPIEAMAALPDVTEGLEHRLYRLCRQTGSRSALLEGLKCKRYTRARLSRLLTHVLIGLTADMAAAVPLPRYARLLGARDDAGPLLRELKSRSQLPVVTRAAELRDDPVFELECRATDLWALCHDRPEERLPGRELTEAFIRMET
ncbi:MAG: nucleotidyltransferase family protein [Clostridia bacterium]|nr:nucleotidyltransferase family protein [Clostridia bacterium]